MAGQRSGPYICALHERPNGPSTKGVVNLLCVDAETELRGTGIKQQILLIRGTSPGYISTGPRLSAEMSDLTSGCAS
ncbi:hypothetical protein KCU61_g54, partial [Aureobasidium melanogenum]